MGTDAENAIFSPRAVREKVRKYQNVSAVATRIIMGRILVSEKESTNGQENIEDTDLDEWFK